jgi:ABC-2 type transport system permease protein
MVNLFKLRLQTEYLRFLLKRNARYMFIMSIAMMTLYPVLGLTVKILSRSDSFDGIREVGLFFNISLLMFTAFMIPLQIMSYMNSKKNLDVYHALPIKRSDLFITSLIAAIAIVVVPFTVGWFSGGLLMMTGSFNFLVIFERYFALISIATAIMSIVLFTMMNTGTSLDAFLYSMTLNFIPILAYGAYILFVQTILLGFSIGDLTKWVGIIFPIFALFESGFEISGRMWASGYVNGLYWLVLSGVIIAISNQFYLRRKSEKAEKPFTNKTFFPTVSGLLIILFIIFLYCVIYSLNSSFFYTSYYEPVNFIFPIFFSMVLYLVMDAIAERGFKHLAKAFLHYLVIAAVAFSLLIGGLWTKGFGYASKIPSLSNIESIDFSYSDYSNFILPAPNYYTETYPFISPVLHLTTADEIAAVHELHKVIIAEFKWIDYNYSYSNNNNLVTMIEGQKGYTKSYETLPFYFENMYNTVEVKITYHLKSGGDLVRSYSIPLQWTMSLLTLNNSPEVIKLGAPNLAKLDQYPNVASANWITPLGKSNIAPLKINLSELKTAYLMDIAALSDAQSISTDYTAMGYLNLTTCKTGISNCITSSVDVDTRFTHVITVLTATGVNLNPAPETALPRATLILPAESPSALITDYPLFKVAMAQSSQRYTYDLLSNSGESMPLTFAYVNLSDEQLLQILPYVAQKGISETPLMTLVMENGVGNFLVQAQYTDEVLAIITANPRKTSTDLYSLFGDVITK